MGKLWFIYWLAVASITSATRNETEERQDIYMHYLEESGQKVNDGLRDDATLDTMQLLAKYGYPAKQHVVWTSDGYCVTCHRILAKTNGTRKGSVILQHGLLSSSCDWIILGPSASLGYMLADKGYDVWMCNSRGNMYSKCHKTLDINSEQFWEFSWHEMGVYDLPAVIDFIISTSGNEELFYIGHSQGTTEYLVMASERPEYANKIKRSFLLAPVAFMGHCRNYILKWLSYFVNGLDWWAKLLGVKELPTKGIIAYIGRQECSINHTVTEWVCENAMFSFFGYDEDGINKTMLPVILAHVPAGSSVYQAVHYGQLINTGKFQMFDYGATKNSKKYGQDTPPEYKVKDISSDIVLFYSDNDYLSSNIDALALASNLQKVRTVNCGPKTNHLDYMWSSIFMKNHYNQIYEMMQEVQTSL